MSLQPRAARFALLFLSALWPVPGRAADFVDLAERYVVLPERVVRVMAADQSAAVLLYVLAPEKLVGWARPLSRAQRAFVPAKFARLPVVGQLSGPTPTAAADAVRRLHPDLIIETGIVSPEAAARADAIEQQTQIPYIVLDGSIQQIPDTLATIGAMLGVGDRGQDLANHARTEIDGLRGRLLVTSATERPLVYYGRGADGLETGLAGAQVMADIDQAGVINVAARLGAGELTSVTREQIFQWDPGDHHRAATKFLRCVAAQPGLARLGRSYQQAGISRAGRPVWLDRRPAGGKSDHRVALAERGILPGHLPGGPARQRAPVLREVLRHQADGSAARGALEGGRSPSRRNPPRQRCAAARRRAGAVAERNTQWPAKTPDLRAAAVLQG